MRTSCIVFHFHFTNAEADLVSTSSLDKTDRRSLRLLEEEIQAVVIGRGAGAKL